MLWPERITVTDTNNEEQAGGLVGPDGLLAGVTKTVLQAALEAEMSDHLGYGKGERAAASAVN
jgi:transposase-like protein